MLIRPLYLKVGTVRSPCFWNDTRRQDRKIVSREHFDEDLLDPRRGGSHTRVSICLLLDIKEIKMSKEHKKMSKY